MGRRMRTHDWSRTPLGPPRAWPQSLKTIVRVMLDSRYAMWMAWGPELTFFCNDAYLPTLGLKRDWALGARSDRVWSEIWSDIGPRIDHVLRNGEATWDEVLLLFLQRSGFSEETYHTFSYSPVYDDLMRIAGMLCVVTEVTERVIGERRLRVLRDLAAQTIGVENVHDTGRRAAEVLAQYPNDLPFAAIYLFDGTAGTDVVARLAACTRQLPSEWFPAVLDPGTGLDPWKVGRLLAEQAPQTISGLNGLGLHVPAGQWPDPVLEAMTLPIKSAGQERLSGFLVAGVSPRRPFDEAYRSFLELLAGQISSAIANARAYEMERSRAEALAEIDRAKTAFFSNVSHEFRTPLTLMIGPVEDMANDPQVPAGIRARLEVVHRNSLRLLKLVNSLLEFSRIEAGRMQAVFEPTDLPLLTRDLVSTFGSALELAGLDLSLRLQPLSEPVYVDRDMWERIVLNLVSNAFKYTLRGGIEVSLTETAADVVLSVRDTGIGIPPEAIPRLFDRFYRVEGAQGRTHEGSGIGLSLVHELVKLHSGTVSVESELGVGTTLRVHIPRGMGHLPAAQIAAPTPLRGPIASARAYVQEALKWLPDTAAGNEPAVDQVSAAERPSTAASASTTAWAPPGPATHDTARPRILIADDNADMRAYVGQLLQPLYEVELVPDGRLALEAARRSTPELIISDVMMPRMDGFELLGALRADDDLRDVPVILLSARAGEEAVIEGLRAMADDYLVKPFSARELLARVGGQLQLARLRREAAEREQSLRREAEALLQQAPMGIYVVDENLRVRAANPTARAVFRGISDPVGLDLDEWIHGARPKEYADEIVRIFRHTLQTGEPFVDSQRLEKSIRGSGPEYYEWQVHCIPIAEGVRGAVCYFRDISAHVHARVALETADRQKNEFLAMLAHELRNPLAPIRNAGEILSRTLPPDSSAHSAIAMVKRQVTQLTRLVDDLLDVSRITQGRVELKQEALDLASVVSQAVEMVEPLFRERQHEVSVLSSYPTLYVNGDSTRLVQCVVNMLTNAAKYTDAGGRIRVESRTDGSFALIEISDTGAGISPELLPRVFDLFVQGERTLDRSLGGLGIGLSVTRRLVEMHGGRVAAESPGLGRGSTFSLWLPRIERPVERTREPTAPVEDSLRVLIVDDNVDAAESLALVLQLDGHTTSTAYSGRQALEVIPTYRPDIVLLDIGLPEMDGYEVARRIRDRDSAADIRIVALTGYGQVEDVRRAQSAGFDDHLVKPVDFETLRRCLAGVPGSAFGRKAG